MAVLKFSVKKLNSDFIIVELWTERKIIDKFPAIQDYLFHSMKKLASVANTYRIIRTRHHQKDSLLVRLGLFGPGEIMSGK